MNHNGRYGPWLAEAPGALTSGVALRLFCVPPVGMGGAAFHPWVKHLPRSVELLSVELPGRGFRLSEAMTAKSLPQLARDVLDGIGRETFVDLPFVLFGHSFGAWLAYEMLQELLRRAWPRPLKLYVSANRAVSLSGSEHDPDQVQPELAQLGADRFWQHFERRYGINPDLQHSYVRDHVRGILQNDFTLLENYIPSTLEQLPVPLCALCAKGDARCRPEQLTAWNQVAGDSFQERWFQDVMKPEFWATEHRYVFDNPSSLLCFLSNDLPLVCEEVPGDTGLPGPLVTEPELQELRPPCQLL
ncbi:unnamed protein product [Durusdinium trenchii]|uniref:Thioesterase domain-containing protein n=1 Tax=Durusdinium trenchii TaxID=1381693 RepID=A0ABP0JI53_9DINO